MHSRADERPVAAIDVGTNTALLLVARERAGAFEVIEDRCESPRLGQGLASTGRLLDEPVQRTLAALALFRERLDALGVEPERVRAVGTACLRRAQNPELLIDPARERLGLSIEVLPEEDEAEMGFRAVTGDGAAADALVLDVGGGSSEVVSDGGRGLVSAPVAPYSHP